MNLLYYRLNLLNDIVDYFVIVEANHTFAGNKKILYYHENKYLFKRFESKIIHIIIDMPYIYPNINYNVNEQWLNEYHQRNSINLAFNKLILNKQDLIIISDLDEIIKPDTLVKLKNGIIEVNDGGFSLLQDVYYYNINTKQDELTNSCKIVTYEKYITTTPQEIRCSNPFPNLADGGWHLSYFGDKTFIKNKIKEFSHQELNNNIYTNDEYIEYKIKNNQDLFDRQYVPTRYISTNENKNLPDLYDKYLLNYIENQDIQDIPIYVYFHICCINNWKEIVSELLFKIRNSGLYNKITEIRCVILGDYDNSINEPKIKIIFTSSDMMIAEKCTINIMYKDCLICDNDYYILYIHSKGVRHFNNTFEKKCF